MTTVQDMERIATLMYVEGKPRHVAESMLGTAIPASLDALPLLKAVLSSSTLGVAVFLSSQLLKAALQDVSMLSAVNVGQLEDLTAFLTLVLQQRGLTLEPYVVTSIVSNLTTAVVQGMLESDVLARFPATLALSTRNGAAAAGMGSSSSSSGGVGSSGGGGPPYAPLVLTILNSLVNQVGELYPRRTLAVHRRTASMFRDTSLLDIFTVAVESVEHIFNMAGQVADDVMLAALRLTQSTLSFDFVCMFPDDGDESPTASIPATWRPLLCKPGFFDMFWSLFENLPAPYNLLVMQCLIQLCSARRSLFQTDEERKAWLQRILRGTMYVTERHLRLADAKILQEFCRLLNRIKPNYQLNELLEVDFYEPWIRQMAQFTTECFCAWRHARSSFLSLCCMWSRLLGSQEFSRKDKDPLFDKIVPSVAMAYVRSCMELAAAVAAPTGLHHGEAAAAAAAIAGGGSAGDAIENPLDDDDDSIRLELDFSAQIVRFCLAKLSSDFCALFSATLDEYSGSIRNRQANPVGEEKLAWLLLIVGALCKSPPHTACHHDAELITLALRAIQVQSDRLTFGGLQNSSSILHLELGCLSFLHNFRKTYVRDPNSAAAKVLVELQDKLSVREFTASEFQQRLLLFFITKIVCNLQYWASSQHVLNPTLMLFTELASAFSSGKHLLGLDPVRSLLTAGETHPFPFQQTFGTHRIRVKYFRTLSSIFFLENVTDAMFAGFLHSVHSTLVKVRVALAAGDVVVLQQEQVRQEIVGCFCDLRGVVASCLGRRHFQLLYKFLSPSHFDTIRQFVYHIGSQDFLLEVQALRVATEICNNRCQRINFDLHSIGGIQLFRFGSSVVCSLGQRLCRRLQGGAQIAPEEQHWLVKETSVVCALGFRLLTGAYCNFGVFALYGDPVLAETLHVLWQVLCCFKLEDVQVYPKLAVEYFQLLTEVLVRHGDFYLRQALPGQVLGMLRTLEEAMRAPGMQPQVCTVLYEAVESLTGRVIQELRPSSNSGSSGGGDGGGGTFAARPAADGPNAGGADGGATGGSGDAAAEPTLLQLVSSCDRDFFHRLLGLVFHNIIHDDGPTQCLLTGPLYLLLALCPTAFDQLVSTSLAGLSEEKADLLRAAVERLVSCVPSVAAVPPDGKPPDAFAKNLTSLRGVAKNIL